jgi:2-iminobutanoate/2-iminopropanoate deaminase
LSARLPIGADQAARSETRGNDVQRTHIDLAKDRSRGIAALKESGVPAVFCDAVRIQLKECALLFISGKVGLKPDNTLAGRTMREQTRQTLENIREVLAREGGTIDDIVRVRVYVTQLDSASLRDIHDVRSEFWTEGKYPASTLVRVDQLIRDGALIEIDADAVIPAS